MELYYDETDKDILILRADGGLNAETAEALITQLEALVDGGLRKIIVDCSSLDYISSIGIAKLMRLHQRLAKHGGDARLAGVRGALVQLMQVVQLNRLFKMYPDVGQARLSFRPV